MEILTDIEFIHKSILPFSCIDMGLYCKQQNIISYIENEYTDEEYKDMFKCII